MNLYANALVATAAVCAAVGIQHVMVALRLRDRAAHLLFAAAALSAAVDAILEMRIYGSVSPAGFHALMPWTAVFICGFLAALAWFIAVRTKAARRWLLIVETAALAATALLDQILPTGISYLRIDSLREVVLPWGETVRFAVGDPNPWRIVADVANVGFLIFLLDTTVRLVRRDRTREAWFIGGSTVVLALSILIIIPIDLGLLNLPAIHPLGFLLVVAAMSWDLTAAVVRESRLSREVRANERRWQQMLESVQLLVIGLDNEGRITSMNPFAEQVSGFKDAEMVGEHYLAFVPEKDREQIRGAVESGLRGDPASGNERVLVTRSGDERIIRWRSVVLHDADGEVEGLLSVGADVTEQRNSEREIRRTAAKLGRAVADLEELRQRLEEENLLLKEEIASEHGFEDIVGSSDPLLYVLHKVKQVAPTDATVLIHGETGVGKELIARSIHRESQRASRPFVAVNCAALPPSLVESELFGHERGAFTGADRQRKGRFEMADGGTLLLDEVGDLPVEIQPTLLRVLQDGEFQRVGGTETLTVDVRVIAATNRDLRRDVEEGRFRGDLFYRIEVYPVTIPPLRDRREDIDPLVRHFVRQIAGRRGVVIDEIPAELMRRLEAYDWPGNVRELQNVVERAVLVSTEGVLRLAEPLALVESKTPAALAADGGRRPTLAELERTYISEILETCSGRIAGPDGAAEILGLHPNTLRSRMKKLGIVGPEKR